MLSSVLFKTLFYYFFVHLTYKIMGKREVGELSTFDFVVSIMIAELTAISIDSESDNFLEMVSPIILLMCLQVGISFITLKSSKIRDYFDGKPSFIIKKGVLDIKEMKKQRYNLDDLLVHLRNNNIDNIFECEYAILEINGELSVFKHSDHATYPLPLILDGIIQDENLLAMGITHQTLQNKLSKENLKLKNIFYLIFQDDQEIKYLRR